MSTQPSSVARVNEIFCSPQGEGLNSGQLQTFIRLHGCNLDCSWCDQPSALSNRPGNHYQDMTVEEIVDASWGRFPNLPICFTGGEPFYQHAELEAIAQAICAAADSSFYFQFETNGTLFKPAVLDGIQRLTHLSISPKIQQNSAGLIQFGADSPAMQQDHHFIGEEAIAQWVRYGANNQEWCDVVLKLIVEDVDNFTAQFHALLNLQKRLGIEEPAASLKHCYLVLQPEWNKGKSGFTSIAKALSAHGRHPTMVELEKMFGGSIGKVRFMTQSHKTLHVR